MKQKIIALDIGEKRIGVAVSDALGMLAHPLKTIRWQGIDNLARELDTLVRELEADKIVVGMPFTLKGTTSQKTEQVYEICQGLRERLGVEIIEQDERLTTRMAENALHAVGKKPSRQRDKIDQIAAVYILQSYLDKR